MTSAPLSVGFRSERGPILIALMLATGLIAIDATILATAVPTIVDDLGDFSQFPWLFSIYLLAQAVSVPVYAQVGRHLRTQADHPRRHRAVPPRLDPLRVAWSMPALIAFRAVQGLGAGAMQPMAITIVGDIYTLAERAKVQGYIASVWGDLLGRRPVARRRLRRVVDAWRWIFFINMPLCLLAALLLIRSFHEKIEKRAGTRIDYAGAAVLTLALTRCSSRPARGRPGLGVELGVERRRSRGRRCAARRLRAHRAAGSGARPAARGCFPPAAGHDHAHRAGVGAVLHRPHLVRADVPQGVARDAVRWSPGSPLAALTLGWPISAALSGRIYLRIGFRRTITRGHRRRVALGADRCPLAAGIQPRADRPRPCFVIGLGLGWVAAAPTLIAAQASAAGSERGVVTGTNMFARSAGSAVGVAVFGAIANTIIAASPNGEADKAAVADAATAVFLAVTIVAALTVIAALAMPRASAHDLEYVAPAEETGGPVAGAPIAAAAA